MDRLSAAAPLRLGAAGCLASLGSAGSDAAERVARSAPAGVREGLITVMPISEARLGPTRRGCGRARPLTPTAPSVPEEAATPASLSGSGGLAKKGLPRGGRYRARTAQARGAIVIAGYGNFGTGRPNAVRGPAGFADTSATRVGVPGAVPEPNGRRTPPLLVATRPKEPSALTVERHF